MLIDNNNKKSEETRIYGCLITDLLLLYALLLLTLAFELQRPIFGRVPCEFQQRQDHSFYKENNPLFEWSILLYLCCYNVSLWNKSCGEAILVNCNSL